jgi:hypothetical protein
MENKNFVCYTNCQGGFIYRIIKEKYRFKNFYHLGSFHCIYQNEKLPIDILKEADIFIYQPVNKKYLEYSTDINIENNILTHLKKDCIKICFPYIYFDCFWPLTDKNYAAGIDGGEEKNINKIVNREVIENLKHSHNNKQIFRMFDNMTIDFKFKERYESTMERLREKEKVCDIKISHLFSEDNLKKRKLMISYNHPTIFVLKYIANEILKILNLEEDSFEEFKEELPAAEKYSNSSLSYYKFEWLNEKDCSEHNTRNLIKKILLINNN